MLLLEWCFVLEIGRIKLFDSIVRDLCYKVADTSVLYMLNVHLYYYAGQIPPQYCLDTISFDQQAFSTDREIGQDDH